MGAGGEPLLSVAFEHHSARLSVMDKLASCPCSLFHKCEKENLTFKQFDLISEVGVSKIYIFSYLRIYNTSNEISFAGTSCFAGFLEGLGSKVSASDSWSFKTKNMYLFKSLV